MNNMELKIENVCCPLCKGTLEESPASLRCYKCCRNYLIKEGIPDLFVQWKVPLPNEYHPFPQYLVSPPYIEQRVNKWNLNALKETSLDIENYFQMPLKRTLLGGRVLIWAMFFLAVLFSSNSYLVGGLVSIAFFADFAVLHAIRARQKKIGIAYLHKLARDNQLHEKDSKEKVADFNNVDGTEPQVSDRSNVLERALCGVELTGKTVLHVGCGSDGDEDVNNVYLNKGCRLIGVDIFLPYLKAFKEKFGSEAVLADALNLPFSDASVDICNCTDIIEHVHDPFRFLVENFRVLRPGGYLLVLTPSRSRARKDFDILNPLVFLQSTLGGSFPRLLKMEDWLASYKSYVFYHASFTRSELGKLLEMAGFEVLWSKVVAYRGAAKKFRQILEPIPFLSNLNDSVIALARKPL